MKILITNDDGIEGAGLLPLVKWATKLGEVTLIAPKIEQSGKSHCANFMSPFEVKRVDYLDGVEAYAVDSTPVDCVRFGVLGLGLKPDLIISGINRGMNIGSDILYSGTCGAVFEASRQNIKAFAISTHYESFDNAVANLDLIYNYLIDNKLFEYNDIYNININKDPDIKGFRITRQGGKYFEDTYKYIGDDIYAAQGYCYYKLGNDLTLDTDAVMNGYISVSPITIDRTNDRVYHELVRLNEKVES